VGAAPEGGDLGRDRLDLRDRACSDGDVRAGARECERDRAADASSAAGHERYASLQ
jgi:hypothetical protein